MPIKAYFLYIVIRSINIKHKKNMCEIIAINRGEIEITNPKEFKEYFGFLPLKENGYNELMLDCCLCQCNLTKTFKQKDIKYWFDGIDTYFVGELERLNKG